METCISKMRLEERSSVKTGGDTALIEDNANKVGRYSSHKLEENST